MNLKSLPFLFCIILIFGCQKDPYVNPQLYEGYTSVLENIDIDCMEGDGMYFISAKINGQDFCHYEDRVLGDFRFQWGRKFTTQSPSIIIGGEPPKNVRQGGSLILGERYSQFNEHFSFLIPDFPLGRDIFDHLDSITSIEIHDIIGGEDIVVPEGTGLVEAELLRVNGGFLNSFRVDFNSIDLVGDNTGGNLYLISSIFGNQEGSFLRFKNVGKVYESDGIYYYLEIEFECNLYHWPQYGYEGLWGEVRDGRIVCKVKVNE